MSLPTFSMPPIGPKQGKIWGNTMLAFAWNDTEAHLMCNKVGYRCSRHYHNHKWNRFLVVTGRLKITMYQQDGTTDETIIGPNQVSDVPPGVEHCFEVLEDTHAMEFYWVGLEADDIVRSDEGGPVE